jgi:pimeloyl-ACP methyl ester carboxylesterase
MTEWQQGDVLANGIRIHYYRTGGDKPPLVLNHGATDNGLCYVRLARVLEADYDLILPDARGHGLSEAPAVGYSSKDRADDLAGLIQALGLTKPIVGGHSMGGATTLRFAADYPDLLSKAILEDPPIWPTGTSRTTPPRNNIRDWIHEVRGLPRAEIIARGHGRNPTWDESEFEPWVDAKLQVSATFLERPMTMASETPWQEVLPRITCPTLLVTADPDKGGIVTPEAAEEAQRLNPQVQVARMRGAGHNVRREQFAAFLGAVQTFLGSALVN